MNTRLVLALVAALACATEATAASRAFVSGKGVDSANCGPAGSPCRTPQYAHDNIVAAGGEIDILDPAGYGAITITKAISIVNDGVGIAGFLAPNQGAAISINAGASDTVVLRGLTIEGSSGTSFGIVYSAGSQLVVRNCVLQKFFSQNFQPGGTAILISPSGAGSLNRIEIANTSISTVDASGIQYREPISNGSANATLVLDHVTVVRGRGAGLAFLNTGSGTLNVAVSNSVSSNNDTGFQFEASGSGPLTGSVQNSYAMNDPTVGMAVNGAAKVYLGNTDIALNGVGISMGTNNTGLGTVYSYGDNQIDGNFDGASTPRNLVGGALLPTPQK